MLQLVGKGYGVVLQLNPNVLYREVNEVKKQADMDNRVFNVNGRSLQMLIKTLELYVENDGHSYHGPMEERRKKFEGYTIDPKKGFVLIKYGVDEKMMPPRNQVLALP